MKVFFWFDKFISSVFDVFVIVIRENQENYHLFMKVDYLFIQSLY